MTAFGSRLAYPPGAQRQTPPGSVEITGPVVPPGAPPDTARQGAAEPLHSPHVQRLAASGAAAGGAAGGATEVGVPGRTPGPEIAAMQRQAGESEVPGAAQPPPLADAAPSAGELPVVTAVQRWPAAPLLGQGDRGSLAVLAGPADRGAGTATGSALVAESAPDRPEVHLAPAGHPARSAALGAAAGTAAGTGLGTAARRGGHGSSPAVQRVLDPLARPASLPLASPAGLAGGAAGLAGGAAGLAGPASGQAGAGTASAVAPVLAPVPGPAFADAGAVAVAAGLAERDTDGAVVFREFAGAADPAPGPEPSTGGTFGAEGGDPAVQRQPSPGAGPSGGPSGGDVDELVRRLYEPLSAQIKAELRLDRERAGFLTDLRH